MCTGAILLYGIPRVVIGENKSFTGEEDLLRSRGVEVVVLDDARCMELMSKFIKERPEVSRSRVSALLSLGRRPGGTAAPMESKLSSTYLGVVRGYRKRGR